MLCEIYDERTEGCDTKRSSASRAVCAKGEEEEEEKKTYTFEYLLKRNPTVQTVDTGG